VSGFSEYGERVGLSRDARLLGAFLWALAVLWFGVGDWVTTVAIYEHPALVEANPRVGWIIMEFGHVGHAVFKLVVLSGMAVGYHFARRVWWVRLTAPASLALAGIIVTLHNVALLS